MIFKSQLEMYCLFEEIKEFWVFTQSALSILIYSMYYVY